MHGQLVYVYGNFMMAQVLGLVLAQTDAFACVLVLGNLARFCAGV